ncbi:hypothetical protein B0O99DRAFT_606147 [Bisporella sp. PMI_857]|nr:hypothetical protein B0O99DRAFT_606147 [Bisporella sp. PMI_857]
MMRNPDRLQTWTEVVEALKSHIENLAWERVPGVGRVIWNGELPLSCHLPIGRRQNEPIPVACSRSISSRASASTTGLTSSAQPTEASPAITETAPTETPSTIEPTVTPRVSSSTSTDSGTILSSRSTSFGGSDTTSIASPAASPTISPGVVTCQQQRPEGAPSGSQIANALSSQDQVATFCAAKFDTSDPLTQNFYHGSMQIQVHRGYDSEVLSYCTEGLNAIIDACIRNGADFGGIYRRGNQVFMISNLVFPNNPLEIGDDGGPPPPGVTICFDERPSDAPTGDQIANALTKHLALETMCSTSFPMTNPLSITFNHQYIFTTLERGYETEPLNYCLWGLNAIIDNCIRHNSFYGGSYTQGDQKYSVKNHIYPSNPLSPYDDGGPPAPTPTPAPPIPIDPGVAPGCIENQVTDIPIFYDLADGRQSLRNLIYRLRSSTCQNLCDIAHIQGVDSQYLVATRFGTSGCEIAIRITPDLELYLYSTGPGQNCYDATDKIINTCIPNYRQGWLNGPNFGEFYQLGTRAMNAPTAVHPPIARNHWSMLPHTEIQLDFIPNYATLLHVARYWELGLTAAGWELRAALAACYPLSIWDAGADPDRRWDQLFTIDWVDDATHCRARAIEKTLGLPWGSVMM